MRIDADVVVAGLGVLGAATAEALASQGLSVVGLDRHRPPHGLGSSHGGSRIIRRVYSEGARYVPLVDRAYRLWRRLEQRTGARLLLARGGLFLGDDDGTMVNSALVCARECQLEHELLSSSQLRRRFPALSPPPQVAGVFDPAAGVLLPERCVEVLLGRAAAAGAALRLDCALDGWQATADGIQVEYDGGGLGARHLVLATGPWLAAAGPSLGVELTVERQVQHWFGPAASGSGTSGLPPFVWELSAERTWYGLPDLGEGLKVGMHRGGEPTTADTVSREVTAAEAEEVRQLVERCLSGAGPHRASAVCMYTNTPDLGFLAGPLPDEPGVWLLGGGSGHAFKFAPALGELVARGIAEDHPPEALAPFLPARFATG